jgi:putative tricarboxylic transport membrane protein
MYLNMFYYIMVPKGGSMNKAGLVFVGISIIIALAFMIPAFSMPGGSVDGAPGPGYFPIIVSVLVIIFAVIQGIVYIKDGTKTFDQTETQKKNRPTLIVTCIGILVYTVLFSIIPFIPLTIVAIVFFNWLYGKKWIPNIVFAVVFTIIVYFVFSKFLHVML